MPDDYDDDLDEKDESSLIQNLRKEIKDRDRSLRDVADAAAERDQLKRQLAFRDAGLDVTNPQVAFLAQHYDGDPTVDAVKAKATELGLITTEPPASTADLEEMQRAAALASGAPAPGSIETAQAEREAAYLTASSAAEVVEMMRKMGSPSAPPAVV